MKFDVAHSLQPSFACELVKVALAPELDLELLDWIQPRWTLGVPAPELGSELSDSIQPQRTLAVLAPAEDTLGLLLSVWTAPCEFGSVTSLEGPVPTPARELLERGRHDVGAAAWVKQGAAASVKQGAAAVWETRTAAAWVKTASAFAPVAKMAFAALWKPAAEALVTQAARTNTHSAMTANQGKKMLPCLAANSLKGNSGQLPAPNAYKRLSQEVWTGLEVALRAMASSGGNACFPNAAWTPAMPSHWAV